MIPAWRLNVYFSRILLRYFGYTFAIFGLAGFLISLLDVFNRSFRQSYPDGFQLISLAVYRTPDILHLFLPIITLIASLLYFVHLGHTQQLMMAQQARLSFIRLMILPLLVILMVGMAGMMVLNPLAANFLEKREQFENLHKDTLPSLLSVADTGIWLRQEFDQTTLIIHALRWDHLEQRFSDVSIWQYHQDEFLQRIEAEYANVAGNDWQLSKVLRYSVLSGRQKLDSLQLQTRIDQDKINNSFTSAETISVWQLSEFIHTIENAGLSAQLHITHLHLLLSQPISVIAMFLLAAGLCSKIHYRQPARLKVLISLTIGIVFFIFVQTFRSLGLLYEWPVLLSIWMPPLLFLMGVFTYILIQESDHD